MSINEPTDSVEYIPRRGIIKPLRIVLCHMKENAGTGDHPIKLSKSDAERQVPCAPLTYGICLKTS